MKNTTAFIISHEPDPFRTEKDQAINIIALTLTRSLGRAGINVVRVHPNYFDDSLSSRFCRATEICPDLYKSERELTSFLTDLGSRYPGKKVLVPASDDCSLYMARNADALGSEYVLLNPTAETMESVMDKRRQYELATRVGVPIPETYFPKSDKELVEIARNLTDYPYVIKPLEAQKWRLRQYANIANGNKAITVRSPNELIEEYQRISTTDNDLMIQEIIAGKDEHLITFLGYCSAKHKPLAHCIRRKLRQSPIDFGYCTATVSCHDDVVERYAKRLLNDSGYTGIVGIEFKYDPRTDEYKLIEINTRPVNTIGLAIGCGVNLPVIAYRDVIGEKQEPVTSWEDGVIWLRLSQDVTAALELKRRGRLEVAQWFRTVRGRRVHAILAMDDLRPFLSYYKRYVGRQIGKLATRIRVPSVPRGARRWLQRVGTWIFLRHPF